MVLSTILQKNISHTTNNREKQVKHVQLHTKQQPNVYQITCARYIQHPSNKARFIRCVVYIDNVARMGG